MYKYIQSTGAWGLEGKELEEPEGEAEKERRGDSRPRERRRVK